MPVGTTLEPGPEGSAERVDYIDGLRGVAILLVVLFHAYARWPDLVPYGDAFANIPVFRYGFAGVELFFVISGYVIFMSLERASGFLPFLWRRWLRLFPAMLICSLLVFATAPLFAERPDGPVDIRQLVPGLAFVSPKVLSVLGFETQSLEGAFWSLYVEFAFYVIVAAAFVAGRRLAALGAILAIWAFAFGLEAAMKVAPELSSTIQPLKNVVYMFGLQYFGWFAAGMILYLNARRPSVGAVSVSILVTALSTLMFSTWGPQAKVFVFAASALFALAVVARPVRRILSVRPLLFLGFVSYPLYLMHENAMIASIVKLGRVTPDSLHPWLPLLPTAGLILAAWLVARFAEPALRSVLRRSLVPAVA